MSVTLNCDKCKKDVPALYNEQGEQLNFGQNKDESAICGGCLEVCKVEINTSVVKIKKKYYPEKKISKHYKTR